MRKTLLTTLVAGSLALCACGRGSGSSPGAAHAGQSQSEASQKAAIEQALSGYFRATAPEGVCQNVSLALESFFDERAKPNGDPAAPADSNCASVINAAAKRGDFKLEPMAFDMQSVIIDGSRAAARIVDHSDSDAVYPVFLIESMSRWLVTADHFVPPGYEDLDQRVLAVSTANTFTIRMLDNSFEPSALTIHHGDAVKFIFKNEGTIAHDAGIVDSGSANAAQDSAMQDMSQAHSAAAGITVAPGSTGELLHSFSHAGMATIVCHMAGHAEAGMTISVTIL